MYTDEFGRQRIYSDEGITYDEADGHWTPSAPYRDGLDNWEF